MLFLRCYFPGNVEHIVELDKDWTNSDRDEHIIVV